MPVTLFGASVCAVVTILTPIPNHQQTDQKMNTWEAMLDNDFFGKNRFKVYFYPGPCPTWHHWWEKFVSGAAAHSDLSVLQGWSLCDLISRRTVVMCLLSKTQFNQKEALMMYLFQLLPSLTIQKNDVSRITYLFGSFGRNSFILERQIHFYIPRKTFHLLSFPRFPACWGCYYGTLWGHR